MSEPRETGKAARQARRNVRRREAKQHGTPIPDPPQTTRMAIPDHIKALAAKPDESAR